MAMRLDAKKVIPEIQSVELREEGATIKFTGGKQMFLDQDQITKVWAMLSLAIDCGCLGEFSSKIKRLGYEAVLQNALHGIKAVRDEDAQIPLIIKEAEKGVDLNG